MYKAWMSIKRMICKKCSAIFTPETYTTLHTIFVAIYLNQTQLKTDLEFFDVNRAKHSTVIYWKVKPGFEKTYSNVLVSIHDHTELKALRDGLERCHRHPRVSGI